MALVFLLTGCGEIPTPPDNTPPYTRPSFWEDFKIKEFYSQSFDGANGNCAAVKCPTNVLDVDGVTIFFHFGIFCLNNKFLEQLSSGYYKRVDISCYVIDTNKQRVSRLITQLDRTDERLPTCFCHPSEHITTHRHNSVWFSYIIPEELLLLGVEKGELYFHVSGIKQESGQEEQEEGLTGCGISYRIHENKVYLADSYNGFPLPEND